MSKRDTRSLGAPMSSAIMDHDRSSTSMMSTPLACVSVWSLAKRGPASATMHKATVSRRRNSNRRPAGGAGRGPGGARDVRAGKAQRRELADAPAQKGIDRQQRQQRQQPRILELEVAGHVA